MALPKRGKFFSVPALKDAIIVDMRKDTSIFWGNVKKSMSEGVSDASNAWNSGSQPPDEMLVKDSRGVASGSILSNAGNQIRTTDISTAWTGRLEWWHIPTLEKDTKPNSPKGTDELPYWVMMNWGSGPNWRAVSGLREIPRVGNVIVASFGLRTKPLRNRLSGRRMSTPIAKNRESGFAWISVSGFGDLKKGFFWPRGAARKLEASLKSQGISANVVSQFPYFTPTHFLEKSMQKVVREIESMLGVQMR